VTGADQDTARIRGDKMFKKVLLLLGESVDGRFVSHVFDFCRKAGAELTVLAVFENPGLSLTRYFSDQKRDLKELVLENHNQSLATELEKAGIQPDDLRREVRWGKDFIEAIKLVQQEGFDLLVCPAQSPGDTPDSTSLHMLRKCPCPVWTHRGHLWKGAIRTLAAVSASDSADASAGLDRKILNYATELNSILGGKLHVIHCWKGYMESVLNSPRFSSEEKAKYLEYENRQSESRFSDILDSVTLPDDVKTKIVYGDPGEVIPRYAEEQMMDIVVMGSVARVGIPGLLVGNTAEKIVGKIENSVFSIKPDGFVSPVK
jgi:nucleotide-binding universal stress UspA family protein